MAIINGSCSEYNGPVSLIPIIRHYNSFEQAVLYPFENDLNVSSVGEYNYIVLSAIRIRNEEISHILFWMNEIRPMKTNTTLSRVIWLINSNIMDCC